MNKLGKINIKSSVLFLCDMQEKFRNTISYFPQIVNVAQRLLKAADILKIPVIVTEQYPEGLGHTVPELDISRYKVLDKTLFSMIIPEVEKYLKNSSEIKSVVLCGIETHACIQQTALDLIEHNYDVHIVADGVSSRNMADRIISLERLKNAGAYITTCESVILSLCKDAKISNFKEIIKIISTSAPNTGLCINNSGSLHEHYN